jgi:hypothetical protein
MGPLAGTWEGASGEDTAPAGDRGVESNRYRERVTLEPIGPVRNHEQCLSGLRYATTAYRLGEADAFHEELGYWLWDAAAKQVLRCVLVPRGVAVLAGGPAEPTVTSLEVAAEAGEDTYGVCCNRFLHQKFMVVRYRLTVTLHDATRFSYEQHTDPQIKGQPALFHHIETNTLTRVP